MPGPLPVRFSRNMTILREEKDLANQVYDGTHTVTYLMSDVRTGDTLDYAYTLESDNSLFTGHYASRFDTGWSHPLLAQRLLITFPSGTPVEYRTHLETAKPRVVDAPGSRTLAWTWRNLRARPVEESVAPSYDHWPYIEFSNSRSWNDVAAWAVGVFSPQQGPGPTTRALAL